MEPNIPTTDDTTDTSESIIAELQETVNVLHSKTEIILQYIEHLRASMDLGNELRM